MTPKVFSKLLGLFVLLLVFHTLVMEFVFHRFVEHAAEGTLRVLGRDAFWSGLIALAVALASGGLGGGTHLRPSAARSGFRPPHRRWRLDRTPGSQTGKDELSAMEAALNQTAERLGKDFAELESSRHELAVMLDSMQEAVVAITAEGLVRWSNAVMQRIAGSQLRSPAAPLVHAVRDPELLACIRGALERRELCVGRASLACSGPRL